MNGLYCGVSFSVNEEISPQKRAEIAQNISVQHIDQLAIQYLGFTCDEMDEIRHDKPHGLDVIREVIRW